MSTLIKFIAASALFLSLPAGACSALEVSDGWIREAPPGATVMAAYARLRNTGATPLALNKARSSDFGAVELHRTLVENGVSRMLHGQVLQLPAGGNAALEPGNWHLMLFRPVRPLKSGDTVVIALECGEDAKPFTFTVRNEHK